MRTSILIPIAALAGLALALPASLGTASADGRASRADILSVEQLKKGMKGYGLTVFEGTQPEPFDIEVIDVLQNFRPHQELILIKTIHPRLDVTKIVAGMSGSPIFVNGRMIGAYSYGWSYGVEPVAGVTPIRAMLDDLERPLPSLLRGAPLKLLPDARPAGVHSASRVPVDEHYHLRAHAADLARGLGATDGRLTPVSTPLLLGGLSDGAVIALGELLAPLGMTALAAGSVAGARTPGPARASARFVDGGAIGVSMISGDLSAMGLGTVTRVEGERLVAFGHPMMNVGITSLPTCDARVLWFMASQMKSFKMGEAGALRGTLVNDRQASIVVHQDASPRTVPVKLRVSGEPGAPHTDWKFLVAHDRFLTPAFLGAAIGSGLETAAAERQDVTYSLRSRVKFVGYPELSFEDFGSSPTGTPGTAEVMESDFVQAVGAAFNNPWQHVSLESIEVDARLHFVRDVAVLRGVELLTPEVDSGSPVRLRVTLEPYGEKAQTHMLSLVLPPELAGQSVRLTIQPGYDVPRPLARPESLGELLATLQNPTEPPRALVVSFDSGGGGAAHHGVVADSLPPGALDRLAVASSSLNVEPFNSQRHHLTDMPFYVVGKDDVTVRIRAVSP